METRLLFVWTGLTSYMGDCWRRLVEAPGVALKVVVAVREKDGTAFAAAEVLRDLDYMVVDAEANMDPATIGFAPDVIFAVGWHAKPCRAVVSYAPWASIPKVCCFDLPWRWKLRCLVAPLVLGTFLRQYRAAFVPGAACARYARWLGFRCIHQGLFAIDTERFRCPDGDRLPSPYFLYIGRNSSEKRLDDLRRAHVRYRAQGGELELKMYGKGLEGGFVRPVDVPALMHGASAFVLASDFDPWPLVLLEAMSAGCPVIASDRCMNRPELGKNWRVFSVGDVRALANAMLACERHHATVDALRENLELARQYDCGVWVKRVLKIVQEVTA